MQGFQQARCLVAGTMQPVDQQDQHQTQDCLCTMPSPARRKVGLCSILRLLVTGAREFLPPAFCACVQFRLSPCAQSTLAPACSSQCASILLSPRDWDRGSLCLLSASLSGEGLKKPSNRTGLNRGQPTARVAIIGESLPQFN